MDPKGPLTLMVIVNRNPYYGKNAETAIKELQEGKTDRSTADTTSADSTAITSRIVIIEDSDFETNSFFPIMGNEKLV